MIDVREQERIAKEEGAALYSQLNQVSHVNNAILDDVTGMRSRESHGIEADFALQERDSHTAALRELQEQIQSLTVSLCDGGYQTPVILACCTSGNFQSMGLVKLHCKGSVARCNFSHRDATRHRTNRAPRNVQRNIFCWAQCCTNSSSPFAFYVKKLLVIYL